MLKIIMTHDNFINDIHPLVRAFIPGEEIEIEISGNASEGDFFLSVLRDDEEIVSFKVPDITGTDRLKMKNILKCTLYYELSDKLGITLPWGTLSGIRPTRLAMDHLNEGFSYEETVKWMQDYYLVSHEKAVLSTDIAERELKIIERINEPDSYSLYIGIPFCPTTCLYCSFPSNAISLWKDRVPEYFDCIEKELDLVVSIFEGKAPVTVYIGGGTPTTLEPEEMKRLFDGLCSRFDLKDIKEFTVEAGRPDSITPEKLKVMKEYRVDRLSVNPQTMKQETLDLIGRFHTVDDTVKAFNMARDTGFDNINMDIILGLPNETEDDVKHTMDEIMRLGPDDLTVHSLAVKRGSRLKENIDKYGLKCMNNTDRMMDIAAKGALEMGLKPYYLYRQKNMSGNFENTGWARPGKEGLYNILMMEEVQSIPALGAGTVSKCVISRKDIRRDGNVKDVNLYMTKIDEMTERKRKLYGALEHSVLEYVPEKRSLNVFPS